MLIGSQNSLLGIKSLPISNAPSMGISAMKCICSEDRENKYFPNEGLVFEKLSLFLHEENPHC